jgi:Glyoxalase-like domain
MGTFQITRIRQAVVVAADRDGVADVWRRELGVTDGFHDPGVGEFGLHNWVFPIGDAFLEVVAPITQGTTAGRYMQRHGGDAGYMVIFQLDNITAARDHMRAEQCRDVWNIDLPQISATHLHPADTGGAIVSLDQPNPTSSWLWGGPDWESRSASSHSTDIAGVSIASSDPATMCSQWQQLFSLTSNDDNANECALPDSSVVSFVASADHAGRAGIVEIALRATDPSDTGRVFETANTMFRFVA